MTNNAQFFSPINYSQYQAYQASSDQDSLISSYVNNLLRDNQGVMSNTTQSWNPNGPSLTSSVVNSITAINIKLKSYYNNNSNTKLSFIIY